MQNASSKLESPALSSILAADLREGLRLPQKQLSPLFLYDDVGAKLFAAICGLPWYHLYRSELALLRAHAREIASALRGPVRVVEFGPGNGEKIEPIVKALEDMQARVDLELVDVSAAALEAAMQRFAKARKVFARFHAGVYESCFDAALGGPSTERKLVAFLGSNLGNFAPSAAEEFLAEIRQRLRPGDGLLLGVDLVKRPEEHMRAYDDPIGVTAAFNKNVLARVNREFGGDFELRNFRHEARWNADEQRVEMHLTSMRPQSAGVAALGLRVDLAAGESIWTESSYKYTVGGIDALAAAAGLQPRARWLDAQHGFMDVLYWIPPLSVVE